MRQLTTRTPAVRRGKPQLTEMYTASNVRGMVVWHQADVIPENEIITISLEKRWIFSELLVSGARSIISST